MKKKPTYYETMLVEFKQRVESLRSNPAKYIEALESLLLEAEDAALYHGDWGLCDSVDNSGGPYQSQFCADVINNIRSRKTGRPTV